MDLEEAKIKSRITPEEKKSVEGYINFGHTQLNILASLDFEKFFDLSNEGWYLSGAKKTIGDDKNGSETLGEEILQKIEDFSNVYSAMYKYSRFSTCPKYVYRGTSNKEARALKTGDTYDRLISTTTNSDISKRFMEYNDAAQLKIHVGNNMPFLNINEFIGRENINRDENEFILAPFSKISHARFSYKNDEYTYYDIELQQPELRAFEEGEKNAFRERIKKEFSKMLELGREYQKLSEQYGINSYRLKGTNNREDIQYIYEKMNEIIERQMDLKPELDEFSEIMKNYIQGLCLEKQREFEEASKIVEEDDKRRIAEERAKILEDQRKAAVDEYNSKILSVNQNFISIPENLEFYANDLILKSEKFSEMCSVIGIPFNSGIDIQSIKSYMLAVQKNIDVATDEIDLNVIPGNSEIELVETLSEVLKEIFLANEQTNALLQEIHGAINQYNIDAINDIKRGIDVKSQAIIKSARIEQLRKKREEVEKRKISFFGKIAGKEKLKEIELENLDLQIEYERTRPVVQKDEYSIHDSLSDVLVFSKEELNGQMTPAMQELFSTVTMYFGINRDSIDKKADEKISYKPVSLENLQIGVREKKSKLTSENSYLKQEIQNNGYINNNYGLRQYNVNSGVIAFTDVLNRISQITRFNSILQKRNPTKNLGNEKDDSDETFLQ